jgi:6-phosphogluconolactonase
MQFHIYKTTDDLFSNAAGSIAAEIVSAIALRGKCSIVLSGGNTPKNLYALLAQNAFNNQIDWHKVLFFWGDERMVPYTDEQNNAKMAFAVLLSKIDVPKENIFRMPAELKPGDAEKNYDTLLHNHFSEIEGFSFDIVLLGLGDDAHTLSLFPHSAVLNDGTSWVRTHFVEKVTQYRITLMPAIVNRSRTVFFIANGAAKQKAFKAVIAYKKDPANFPAQLIQLQNGMVHWFVDEAVI